MYFVVSKQSGYANDNRYALADSRINGWVPVSFFVEYHCFFED